MLKSHSEPVNRQSDDSRPSRVPLGAHLVKTMERGFPQAIELLADSERRLRHPLPDPHAPAKTIHAFAKLKSPFDAVRSLAKTHASTHVATSIVEECKEISAYLDAQDWELRRLYTQTAEDMAKAAGHRFVPSRSKKAINKQKSAAVKRDEYRRLGLLVVAASLGLLAEMINSFVNTPGEGVNWFVDLLPRWAFSAWLWIAPFVLLKFTTFNLSPREARTFDRRLGWAGVGLLPFCLLLFSFKLAEMHGPISMSDGTSWSPPYALSFFANQTLFALAVYAALKMAAHQWREIHGLRLSHTDSFRLAAARLKRIDRCQRGVHYIRGVVNGARKSLEVRERRIEGTYIAELLNVLEGKRVSERKLKLRELETRERKSLIDSAAAARAMARKAEESLAKFDGNDNPSP